MSFVKFAGGVLGQQGGGGGGFVPTDIAGIVAWYDAADAATITESSGAVSAWNDKSGNGYHLAQSTPALQPTTNATTQNSRNVLDFYDNVLVTASATTLAQPYTIIAVTKWDGPGSTQSQVVAHRSVNTVQFIVQDGGWATALYAGTGFANVGSSTSAGVWFTHGAVGSGTSSFAFLDGTTGPNTNAGTAALSLLRVGGRAVSTPLYLRGSIAEIVIYNSALGSTDRTSIIDYYGTKWGL